MRYIHGTGNGVDTACVMSAARAKWLIGADIGEASDELDCACPVLRALVIRRNDATPLNDLQSWAPAMIDRIIGSRRDAATTHRRAEAVARYAVTAIAADVLAAAGLTAQAATLRGMPATATMDELRIAAANATNAANDAAYAAYAANAAAAVAANVANAANAAAANAADDVTKRLTYLDEMIALVMEIQ